MLKIAILSSGLGHIPRGIEIWSANLANLLSKNNMNVTLFKGGGVKKNQYERVIPCISMNSKLWSNKNLAISWGLRYIIQQYSFVFFSIPFLRNYSILQTSDYRVGKMLYKAKKIGLIKGEILFTDGNIFNLELLRGFDYVHETSTYYVDQAKKLNINTKNWFVIPHFVDTDPFKPSNENLKDFLSIPDDAFVIVSVGAAGDDIKRMKWLIDEIYQFKRSNIEHEIHLIITSSKESNADDIIDYGEKILLNNIHFLFDIPHDDMNTVYNTADVFVLCSLIERFGLVFIEAMACGVPAIGHTFPVTQYIIGEGGDCIDMTERGKLSNTLRKYLYAGYRNNKSKNAIKIVRDNFSDDAVFDGFKKAYDMISKK